MKLRNVILSVVAGSLLSIPTGHAQEPSRLPVVVARGELREQIKSTSILERPYRPLHFYGNAVRRAHYHGTLQTPSVGISRGVATQATEQ